MIPFYERENSNELLVLMISMTEDLEKSMIFCRDEKICKEDFMAICEALFDKYPWDLMDKS